MKFYTNTISNLNFVIHSKIKEREQIQKQVNNLESNYFQYKLSSKYLKKWLIYNAIALFISFILVDTLENFNYLSLAQFSSIIAKIVFFSFVISFLYYLKICNPDNKISKLNKKIDKINKEIDELEKDIVKFRF